MKYDCSIDDIPTKYRTESKGEYNILISTCPECHNRMMTTLVQEIVGFARVVNGVAAVVICNKCGYKYWFHADEDIIEMSIYWM